MANPRVWELYRHRADAETQIREIKESCGLDGFFREEAVFTIYIIAFN